ncbi:glycoside hydrolase family 28 protein [Myceligenerans pegani]|uniref:Glycoside hydrolase family 28 protein n=1 Tax=Myceligenerans pegani TaxID=2776917 RepID=A0ABR9MV38_9MICO|nr:glycoside hydrolase family 28 protein [Myceligenerans sp. TRM 65318]MBE1875252.1 glycoside hydrolase family 28 protein [Myceligenerans sp. TRM 65318]MBE3017523.1 glycoside hydrolase family 28 protein [Myceligenerans sp. TRM 65318]
MVIVDAVRSTGGHVGGTLRTAVLQAAIDAAAREGGGTVTVGAGVHRTGALRLRSHVELRLEAGARLEFVPDRALYPPVEARWEGAPAVVHSPCLYAHGATDVAITGLGTIDGGGVPWWDTFRNSPGDLDHPRPTLIGLHECERVTIRDVTLRDSPSWTVHPLLCEDVAISGVRITNPADSPNTDGINPESCRNVRISDCHIDVGDDCVTIKSGTERSPRRVPCENITVTGCTMVHGHGGVVIGSEMSGGVRNVVITGCVFQGTDRGIRIKARRGRGGVVEDVRVSNVVMSDVMCPLVINPFYFCGPGGDEPHVADRTPHPVDDTTPLFRRIHVAHVSARGVHAAAAHVYGLPEQPVTELTLDDVVVSFADDPVAGYPAMADGVELMTRRGFHFGYVADSDVRRVRVDGCDGPGVVAEHSPTLRLSEVRIDGKADDDG